MEKQVSYLRGITNPGSSLHLWCKATQQTGDSLCDFCRQIAKNLAYSECGTGDSEMLELALKHHSGVGVAAQRHSSASAENDNSVSSLLPGSMVWPSSSVGASAGS